MSNKTIIGIFFVFFILLLIPMFSSEIQNQFNDTTLSQNFSGVGAWTNLTYIKIPKTAVINDAYLNLTGNTASNVSTSLTGEVFNTSSETYLSFSIDIDSNNDINIIAGRDQSFLSENIILYFKKNAKNGTWTREVVNSSVGGYQVSVAIDSNNIPHICFVDYFNGKTYYANRTGGTWSYKDITNSNVDSGCKIDIDYNGNIGISVHNGTFIRYFLYNQSTNLWTNESVITNGDGVNNLYLKYDHNNIPQITYTSGSNTDLYYGNRTGGTWSTSTIATSNYRGKGSLWIDKNNVPHVAEIYNSGDDIIYYNKTSGTWYSSTVFSGSDGVDSVSDAEIITDASNKYGIVYSYYKNSDSTRYLKYTYYNGTSWVITQLLSDGTNSFSEEMTERNGGVHIASLNSTTFYYFTNALYPSNVTLDIGNNGTLEFNHTGLFTTNNQTSNFTTAINTFLSTCTADDGGFCYLPINISGTNGLVQLNNINITLTEIPRVNMTYPQNTTYSSSITTLNYTAYDLNLDKCWYSLNGGTTNTTITCGQNVTGLNSGDGNHNWTIWANDTFGNLNFSQILFTVALSPPAITLNYPTLNKFINTTQNIDFNFTGIDSNGLSTCQLWGNWTGWHKNETFTSVTSNVLINTKKNISDGYYLWNAWCNDSTNSGNYSTSNYTFTVDTIQPLISTIDITITDDSQDVSFNVSSYTELNCNSAWYSVYDSLGILDIGLIPNKSLTCSQLNDSFTVTGSPPKNYMLRVWMNDSSGNVNYTEQSFITVSSPPGGSPGGGGDIVITKGNWTVETDGGGSRYQLNMIANSNREKSLYFQNLGLTERILKFSCQDIIDIPSICSYISFNNNTVILSNLQDIKTQSNFKITLPENIKKNIYSSNIVITDDEGNIALITIEVNVGNFNFLVEIGTKLTSSKKIGLISIPYIIIVLFAMIILTTLMYLVAFKKVNGGGGISFILAIFGSLGVLVVI